MDILERLEDSPLGAAVRRLTFCPRPEPEPPDEQGLLPTYPTASDNVGDSRIAPADRPTDPEYDKTADKHDHHHHHQHQEHDQQQQQQPDGMICPTTTPNEIIITKPELRLLLRFKKNPSCSGLRSMSVMSVIDWLNDHGPLNLSNEDTHNLNLTFKA